VNTEVVSGGADAVKRRKVRNHEWTRMHTKNERKGGWTKEAEAQREEAPAGEPMG